MSKSSEDYKQYKLVKELKQKQSDNFINDYSSISDLENAYCDLCDRQLILYEREKLICPVCQIISDTKFTLVKRKPTRQGPVDEDIIDVDDVSIVSEYYSWKKERKEADQFIDSLKAQGITIISSKQE